jgi:hypothetical protein
MAGNSAAEHDYQVKVLDRILAETGGKISAVGEDPTFKNRDFLNMIKGCFIPRLAFRLTGTFNVDGMLGMDTMAHAALGLKMDEVHRNKWAAKGVIIDDGTFNSWGTTYEGTHFALFECGHPFSSIDTDSVEGMQAMTKEGTEAAYKTPFAFNWSVFGAEEVARMGSACYDYTRWMRQIKRSFDPNNVSDPMGYISPEEGR